MGPSAAADFQDTSAAGEGHQLCSRRGRSRCACSWHNRAHISFVPDHQVLLSQRCRHCLRLARALVAAVSVYRSPGDLSPGGQPKQASVPLHMVRFSGAFWCSESPHSNEAEQQDPVAEERLPQPCNILWPVDATSRPARSPSPGEAESTARTGSQPAWQQHALQPERMHA